VEFYARDDGSLLTLPTLASFSGSSNQFYLYNGGSIQAPLLATFSPGTFTVYAATAGFPALTDIDDTSITVYGGGKLTLSGVTGFDDSGPVTPGWNAYDAGSEIDLPT